MTEPHGYWRDIADRKMRQAHPRYYWFHTYGTKAAFLWEEIEITEEEYRANANEDALRLLDATMPAANPNGLSD